MIWTYWEKITAQKATVTNSIVKYAIFFNELFKEGPLTTSNQLLSPYTVAVNSAFLHASYGPKNVKLFFSSP
jgi:hypothetical protein